MRKILIATHSEMGKGMVETLKFLTSINNIYAIDAYTSEITFEQQVENFFKDVNQNDTIIILTDMQGGSVNQKLCEYRSECIHLICGVNLPLALAIALYPQEQSITSNIIINWIDDARQQMLYMNTYEVCIDGEDE